MSTNYIVHTVSDGDTVQLIGKAYKVDWTEIVTLNGLEYPYIDTDIDYNENSQNDTVAKIGSRLVIPSTGLNFPKKSNNSSEEIEKYAFGCDLDLFSAELGEHFGVVNLEIKGQLTDNSKGDVKLAEGIENLKQQLIIRLGTEKGALSLHPNFGSRLRDWIGLRTTSELLTKAQLEVQECLLGDFRVQRVENVQVAYSGKAVHVDCGIVPISPYSAFTLSHTYSE